MKKFAIFLSIFLVYVIICMVARPEVYIQSSLDGIKAWAFNVLPSVLPFLFLTKALAGLGDIEKLSKKISKPFQKFFNCPPSSGFVFLMSIISGYPVGAKMTADLYQSGKITKSEAYRMTSFTSTSGPMFIIGAVGVGMLLSAKAGYIILISHILGAFLNGFLYKKIKAKDDKRQAVSTNENRQNIGQIVTDSTLSILSVGTIIAIFFVIIQSLSPLISVLPEGLRGIVSGLIEITHGCIDISALMPLKIGVIACTFVISFGGISTILQSLAMLDKLEMPVHLFVLQKISHALISAVISAFLVLFL